MATRYHRVNLDGLSIYQTETYPTAAANNAGKFVKIVAKKFATAVAADVGAAQLYILEVQHQTGLTILDAIPVGESAIGNYVQEGRVFAARAASGLTFKKDDPVFLTATGTITATVAADMQPVGYSQDDVTLTQDDFVMIRIK